MFANIRKYKFKNKYSPESFKPNILHPHTPNHHYTHPLPITTSLYTITHTC